MEKIKIEKQNSEVLNIRKTISNTFTITNSKGEKMEIDIVSYYQDDEFAGYDNDETIYKKSLDEQGGIKWSDTSWDEIQDFLGENEDIDDLQDEINELKDK